MCNWIKVKEYQTYFTFTTMRETRRWLLQLFFTQTVSFCLRTAHERLQYSSIVLTVGMGMCEDIPPERKLELERQDVKSLPSNKYHYSLQSGIETHWWRNCDV